MNARDRIIVALDTSSRQELRDWAKKLGPHVGSFKIGKEVITAIGGPDAVGLIHAYADREDCVFYDGKFHDIPETMAKASKAAAGLGVEMFNVHASADVDGMEAAVANKGAAKILAVTVLTSFDDDNCEMVYNRKVKAQVKISAHMAVDAGVDGLICSAKDLEWLNEGKFRHLLKVTPGVRSAGAARHDQKRVATPAEAIRGGAWRVVIGRQILQAGNPVDEAKRIADEIAEALA